MTSLLEQRLAALPAGLSSLLRRLKTYQVQWQFSFVPTDEADYEPGIDREEADLAEANVVSSEHRVSFGKPHHVVALDIDHAAWLIPSSTEGHSHLYIDVPGGIPHEDYMELLDVLARCKVIEHGYASVSKSRGHSDLRLPWVSKADQHTISAEESARIWEERVPKPEPTPDPWETLKGGS